MKSLKEIELELLQIDRRQKEQAQQKKNKEKRARQMYRAIIGELFLQCFPEINPLDLPRTKVKQKEFFYPLEQLFIHFSKESVTKDFLQPLIDGGSD